MKPTAIKSILNVSFIEFFCTQLNTGKLITWRKSHLIRRHSCLR